MGWHRDAFCDWQPIRPDAARPCKGGCGVHVNAADGLCRRCRKALADRKPCGVAAPLETPAVKAG